MKGHYHEGSIELFENPGLMDSDVIITFLGANKAKGIDLQERVMDKTAAQSLMNRVDDIDGNL